MQSIERKLTLSYVLVSLVTVVIMGVLFFTAIYQYYVSGIEQTLLNHASADVTLFDQYAPAGDISGKRDFIFDNVTGKEESALVELYDPDEHFLINNSGEASANVELTPDYYDALEGKQASWNGRLSTKEPVMSVSVPIHDGDKVVGVLRYLSSMRQAQTLLQSNMIVVVLISIAILVISAIIGYTMSNRILVPIRDLRRVTREIANGNLNIRAEVYYNDEIGQLAHSVNRMTEEIALSDKSKNDFISSISHELRTPLTSINGWTETLEDTPEDVETVRMGLDIISRETRRLIHLVNDLLDFSKLQSHRIELEIGAVWLDEFLEALYNQFLPRATQEGVTLRLHLDDEDAELSGDEARLRQVFINVIDNSFKFVKGRAHPEITIQSHMLDDQVVITVEDNGPGMSSGDLMRVKEKFYKGSSRQSGTGLGLSIANEIVMLHGGTFYIDSIRGVGTKVSVVLPFEHGQAVEEDIELTSQEAEDSTAEK